MMKDQNQTVANSAVAVQAQGDAVVTIGMTSEQVQDVIHAAYQAAMPMFQAVAREVATERMADFERRVSEQLATQSGTRREALEDPDFQFLLTRGHYAYARSGDDQVGDTLVDLIGQRAKEVDRTRLSLTLNDAVETAAKLTKNEFAELTLVYLLRRTRNPSIDSLESLANYVNRTIMPLLDDLSESEISYNYLEAHSCAQVAVTSVPFRDLFHQHLSRRTFQGYDRGSGEGCEWCH